MQLRSLFAVPRRIDPRTSKSKCHSKNMSCQHLLVNGVLVNVTLEPETSLTVTTRCGLHLVNLGKPCFCVVRRCGIQGSSEGFGLSFGGVAKIECGTTESEEDHQTSTEKVELVFSLLEPALNFTEIRFAKQVKDVLLQGGSERKQPKEGSVARENKSSTVPTSTNGCGALEIKGVARHSCAETRCPKHAAEMIAAMGEVNAFDGQNGEKMCVGKKRSKPRSVWMCPRLEGTSRIDVIARRAAIGEAMWRQCGASFSTMMRHFQKSPAMFRWEPDAERRTIITISKS